MLATAYMARKRRSGKVLVEDGIEKVDTPSRKICNKFEFGQEQGFGV